MSSQSNASQTVATTARTVPAPPLKAETVLGLSAMIGKIRQIVRFEPVTPFAQMSDIDRDEMQKEATVLIHSQDLVRSRTALELALQAAEGALADAGFVPSREGVALARRIALTALTTHRLALEGALDQVGGVQ